MPGEFYLYILIYTYNISTVYLKFVLQKKSNMSSSLKKKKKEKKNLKTQNTGKSSRALSYKFAYLAYT